MSDKRPRYIIIADGVTGLTFNTTVKLAKLRWDYSGSEHVYDVVASGGYEQLAALVAELNELNEPPSEQEKEVSPL